MAKEIITLNENGTIKSTDLVDIVNEFRKEEFDALKTKGLNKKAKYTKLQHYSFMEKIRKELEVLETIGLDGEKNFLLAKYNDKQGKERDCYELTRDGMLQMLNSESALVRYKTIQYIDKLEEDVKQLELNNKQLTEIAESDEEREERIRKANIVNYSVYNIKKRLLECDYTNIEATVNKIIEIHEDMYVKERDIAYQNTDKYGFRGSSLYINHIKTIIENKLDEIRLTMVMKNPNINSIILEINRELHKKVESSKNITSGRKEKTLQKQLDEAKNNALKKEKELLDIKEKYDPDMFWTTLNYHPFSINYMYKNNQITSAYQRWIDNFPKEKLHSKAEYEQRANIDFNKPIIIYVKYRNLSKFDTDNLSKSLIDYIFNRHLLVDDSIVKGKVEFTQEHCRSYEDGQIRFTLRNMTDDEINRLND